MTKKKSKKGDDQQFQLNKPKSTTQNPPLPKNRSTTRIQKDKKQPQPLPVFNKMYIEDRKAYEQKYRQNLVARKIEQQKRGFRPMRYDNDADSQLGDIDEDSVTHRNQNQTIKRIKQLLQEEQMIANRQRCFLKAKNQLAKVQKLSQMVYERKGEYRQIIERVRPDEKGLQIGIERSEREGEAGSGTGGNKTVVERIAELEGVYY